MTQASSLHYSTLKDTLLKMWVPAVGVQTADDFVTKNIENFFGILNIDNYFPCPSLTQDVTKEFIKKLFKRFVFKADFDSYFDAQPPFQLGEVLLTGSLSEGLFLYHPELPDMDFMCVLKNITFSQEDQEDGSLQLREDTPFVYAFITNKETQDLWRDFFDNADKQDGKHRLMSRKLKEKLQKNYQKNGSMFFPMVGKEQLEEVTEGAAVTINKSKPDISYSDCMVDLMKIFFTQPLNRPFDRETEYLQTEKKLMHALLYKIIPSSDVVLSIFCEGWPSTAREWITRERLWPDFYSVDKITQVGFHIVPKSSPDGDFRLSFSCAESMLIKTLSPLQHRVMRAFKAVVKYHENIWSPNLKEIISSYHLKTIAFWYFEKTSPESWTEETLVHHLVTLHEELAEALRIQNLPMYFMPKVNLLQDFDDPEITLDLMEKVLQLSHEFSAMSTAINHLNNVKKLFAAEFEYDNPKTIWDAIRAEKLRRAEEDGETSFTFYDIFVAQEKLAK